MHDEEAQEAFGSSRGNGLAAALMVAAAPPVFAQGEGCYYGQQHAFTNAILHDNDEQVVKHLGKFGERVGQGPSRLRLSCCYHHPQAGTLYWLC